ncbi:MAG TPA: glycosyltransferase [Cyanobacteria bacterium UBA8553]|nr:glycosyltransferase [Cyanobacteria bacterium UBA8553]
MKAPTISIIIPVLNEAATIEETLTRVQDASDVEVIIVDGGSRDETVAIANYWSKILAPSLPIRVISAAAGRANQMNAGAAIATGDILLFLHADTHLPTSFDSLVRQALQNPGTIAGAFELRIDAQLRGLRWVEKMVNMRSRFFSMPYGDQAIFLKATIFHEVGGFPNLAIMEDFELIRHLKRQGKIAIVSASVLTSGRRWQKLGVLKTTLINQLIIAGYFLGISPSQLVLWYRQGGFKRTQ